MDQTAPPESQSPGANPPPSQASPTATPTTPAPSVQPASMPPSVPSMSDVPPPPPSEKRRLPFISLLIIVVLVIAVVGVILYLRQSLYQQINQHGTTDHDTSMSNSETMTGQMQHTLQKDKIIIGSDTTYPPMEYLDDKGEIVGFTIDLGKEIAKEMGVKAEVKTIAWDDIFTALENKQIDVIMSSVSITDERKKKYDFSDPYLNAGQVIITAKANTTITKPADLTGKKVGAQEQTTSLAEAKKYSTAVVSYPDPEAAIADLLTGKLDAVIADLPAAKGFTDENPTLKIASDPFTSEYYGIVFRKGDTELRNDVNAILTELQQKGILADLKEKWLQ